MLLASEFSFVDEAREAARAVAALLGLDVVDEYAVAEIRSGVRLRRAIDRTRAGMAISEIANSPPLNSTRCVTASTTTKSLLNPCIFVNSMAIR